VELRVGPAGRRSKPVHPNADAPDEGKNKKNRFTESIFSPREERYTAIASEGRQSTGGLGFRCVDWAV
jgi:hypothetical protein